MYSRRVIPCASVSEFIEAPVGRCIAGESWLYFHPRVGLCGFAVWGRPTEDDVAALVRVLALELALPPHVSLVDVRRVASVEPRAFGALEAYVREHREALARVVTKLALVRPSGLIGAVTAGFFGVQSPPYPVDVFDDAARALAWLGLGDRDALLAEIDRAIDHASGAPALLRAVREWIESHLEGPTPPEAARALGTSARSLQRWLSEHATTFQGEVSLARVRVAQRMLLDTEAQLTRVALEVGCGSLPSFSALFRKITGETPSAWRTRMRARPER
jgi:AraC-like DNA-binding protein